MTTNVRAEHGYAMAALLVAMSIMAVSLSMLMPAWQTMVKREREAELIFRGEQYANAIAMFQRERGAYPPSIDVLVNEKFLRKKYKDPITNDDFQVIVVGQPLPGQDTPPVVPGQGGQAGRAGQAGLGQLGGSQQMGRQGGSSFGTPAPQSGFTPVSRGGSAPPGPVLGVVSKSTATSLRIYNGRNKYNEWAFVATEATMEGGTGGTPTPDGRGGTATPGLGRGRGGQGIGPRGTPTGPRGGGERMQFPPVRGGRGNQF